MIAQIEDYASVGGASRKSAITEVAVTISGGGDGDGGDGGGGASYGAPALGEGPV